MAYSAILYRKNNHIASITLNRPEIGNIVDQQLTGELEEACRDINQDGNIYVALVTGAGDKVFCSGGELERSIPEGKVLPYPSPGAAELLGGITKPVIVAVNGDAIGQGLELALSCDIRLASREARFGLPQIGLGIIPTDGGTQRLPRLVGRGKALELALTGDIISAEEAFEIGLVSKVVERDRLAAEADALVESIATKAPVALRYIKEAVNKGMDLTLDQGLNLEADLYFLLHTTHDRTEGIRAFLEKRAPRFRGE